MGLNSHHPDYDKRLEDWNLMAHSYEGETTVKSKGELYLPPTPSQIIDGMGASTKLGQKAYDRYLQRAVYWDYVRDGVESLVGLLHMKDPVIKLPKGMEPLRLRASREGESLKQVLRRINEQQLVCGRLGLLVDLPTFPDPKNPMPYIALYTAVSIINWDDSADMEGRNTLQMVVLDETSTERQADFSWKQITKYRVLQMMPPTLTPEVSPEGAEGDDAVVMPDVTPPNFVYKAGVFKVEGGTLFDPSQMMTPMLRGQVLNEIPFTFVNTKDIIAEPDVPPLLGLARLCMAIYRGEADYRQSLFMQGQDTLVIIGPNPEGDGNTAQRVGAGATIEVNLGGDAKYIGVTSEGLSEQREALQNDKKVAATKAGQLVAPDAGKQESGDALTTRVSAQTASLQQIALTGAVALETALKNIAKWLGENPDEVEVHANTEFVSTLMTAKDLSDLMDARSKGSPQSLKSIHGVMAARGMTTLTFDEEVKQIVLEKSMEGAAPIVPPLPIDPNPKPTPKAA
jgi:hypothetical protein